MVPSPRSILLAGLAFLGFAPPASAGSLAAGPMLGPVELRTATIWTQTADPATVQLRYFPVEHPARARLSDPIETRSSDELTASFRLFGLEPGIAYQYEVFVDGTLHASPEPFTFQTQPLWQYRTDPPAVRAIVGSCFYVNEPAYDRPGTPYGSDFEILSTIAAEDADLMIWLGDNVYTREADLFSPEGLAHRYRHARALPELQPLLAAMSHYAIWDDHDYGPNNSDRYYPLKETSLQLMRLYWPAPVYGTPEAAGAFQKVTWGDVDFFLCDDRWYRMPETWPDGPDKAFLGREQLAWLKGSLLYSRAPFKFICIGSQVLNTNTRYETMAKYPHERDELLEFLAAQRIDGVVFLTGDRHHTELLRVDRPGAYPLYDFTCSSLTAGASERKRTDPEFENPLRVSETFVHGEHSYGLIEVSGPQKERVLTMRARGMDGKDRWTQTVRAADLSFPRGER